MSGSSSEPGDAPSYAERRGCLEKHAHRTQQEAIDHLRHCQRRENRPEGKGGKKLRVYRCRFCGMWHVGHGVRRLK